MTALDAALARIASLEKALRASIEPSLDVERLRIAAWRLSNAAETLARHARHPDDEGHRSWFPSAIGDVEREVRHVRGSAPRPTNDEYEAVAARLTQTRYVAVR